jgi:regulator of sigma E protease
MEVSSLVDFLYAILAFGIVLIPAIIIHELGHLLAAKAVGINVLEFGIGFPPRMLKLFRWGETDFTLNWLPLGGFVRPLGEDFIGPVKDEDEEKPEREDKHKNDAGTVTYVSEREELLARGVTPENLKSVNQAKPWERIIFMVSGASANFLSAIVFFMIIALIGLPTIIGARLQVTGVLSGSPLARAGIALGDAIEQVNGAYFQSPQQFVELWSSNYERETTLVMRGLESGETYSITVVPRATGAANQVLIMGIEQGSPAQAAGLLPGDAIVAVSGNSLANEDDPIAVLQAVFREFAGTSIQLSVLRNGETLTVSLVPRVNPPAGQGRAGLSIMQQRMTTDGLSFIEANPQTINVPQNLGDSLAYGLRQTGFVLEQIAALPGQLLQGKVDPEMARPVSIVGISRIGGRFLQQSIEEGSPVLVLNFLALISIFLGFTNLLPLPPLDGGRIVFVLIEMIRGKPVPIEIEATIYKIGIAFLLGLGALVILLDVIRPIPIP